MVDVSKSGVGEQRARTQARRNATLIHALGSDIGGALEDADVLEVMLNPDGSLWIDHRGEGRLRIGTVDSASAETVIRIVATEMGQEIGVGNPYVSGTLPTGERFQGVMPPVTAQPAFTIRKHAPLIYSLDDFVKSEVLSQKGAEVIREALADKQNIIIAGATSSGKTTLLNGCLAEPCFARDRVVILEDVRELQCSAPDCVPMLTTLTNPPVTLADLVRMTLRLFPGRIVIGEVRGGECLALLRAWNTGHAGLSTLHANSAQDVLYRIEELVGEVSAVVPRRTISSAIGLIVYIACGPFNEIGRRVTTIVRPSLDRAANEYLFEEIDL